MLKSKAVKLVGFKDKTEWNFVPLCALTNFTQSENENVRNAVYAVKPATAIEKEFLKYRAGFVLKKCFA